MSRRRVRLEEGLLSALLVPIAIFFGGSVQTMFGAIPQEVLGVILFLTGTQLALSPYSASVPTNGW